MNTFIPGTLDNFGRSSATISSALNLWPRGFNPMKTLP